MFGWFKKRKPPEIDGLRAVPGAGVYQSPEGRVVYNMLDPLMQQFMGRCVGAVKKAGIRAKGTGQFSILLGDDQRTELQLDEFWGEFTKSHDAAIFERVAAAARAKSRWWLTRHCTGPGLHWTGAPVRPRMTNA